MIYMYSLQEKIVKKRQATMYNFGQNKIRDEARPRPRKTTPPPPPKSRMNWG